MTQDERPAGSETFPLGAVERAQLGRVLAVLAPVAVLAAAASVLLFPRQTGIAVVIALVAAAALAVVGVLLVRLPCFLTRQGLRAEATGLTLFAEPLWWFRGWRIVLPPAAITDVTPTRSNDRPALAISVDGPTRGGGPVWCTAVQPGAAPPDGRPADDHRLLLQLPEPELDRVRAAIERVRGNRPRATAGAPVPVWISVRLGPAVVWGLASVVGLAVTQLPLWSLVTAGTASGWTDPALIVLIILAVAAIVPAVWFAPSALARQGVVVDQGGLEVRRDRLGWQPGCRWRIPWADLRGLSGVYADPGPLIDPDDQPTKDRGPATVLELILNQSPAPPVLPGWARVVPPGVEARRVVADRPRLLIKAGDPGTAAQLRYLISRRLPEAEPDDPDQLVRTVRWIAVPRRGPVSMIIAAGVLILVGAGWLGSGVRPFANAPLWQDVLWPVVPLLAGVGLAGLIGWFLPSRLARGGVQVEPAGIQLVRERFLWRTELRSRLPWSGIGEIRVVRVFSPGGLLHGAPFVQAVELTLNTTDLPRLPHWAGRRDAGARLLVHTGDAAAARMISTIADVPRDG
ncbi:hypothetical protein [Microlunatus parietis]|uniref:Uncharacterized protein n=1 Tax=Microlunatus parietis TaxID=682979 RepID=A0A7Y9LBD8_9ACTN|nr:hypothetical protein [Microlunatus parietis]NYE71627.1 hypothetical protein [Microlunatus parietis]